MPPFPMPGPMPVGGPVVSGPYIGGSPTRGFGNVGGFNSAGPIVRPMNTGGATPGTPGYSGLPASTTVSAPPSNVLGAGAVRPTGPSSGFDPSYLQNLATAIGGLFSRPGGNLSFNPLGDLSDIASPALGFGNAASPGLPPTMLQDAINGLAFLFNPPPAPAPSTGANTGGAPLGSGNVGNRRGNQLI